MTKEERIKEITDEIFKVVEDYGKKAALMKPAKRVSTSFKRAGQAIEIAIWVKSKMIEIKRIKDQPEINYAQGGITVSNSHQINKEVVINKRDTGFLNKEGKFFIG